MKRVRAALLAAGIHGDVVVLDETSRTARDAAAALGVEVGQIASSLVFRLPTGDPVLVITSGRHRVDPSLVARALGVAELRRADADYVKAASGFSKTKTVTASTRPAPSSSTVSASLPR